MLLLCGSAGLLLWGAIVLGVETHSLPGKAYWAACAALGGVAALLAGMEAAATLLAIRLRRVEAVEILERALHPGEESGG